MLDHLNENQRRAVTTTEPYVRVIAGAGSGKTRVLTTRIAYFVEYMGVDPKKIVAITFTNKAANEMKQRVESMLGPRGLAVHISTIHSLCVRILREDIIAMQYPRNFTVMDADDQKSILKEAYKEYGLDVKSVSYGVMLDYIANNKSAEISCEHALKLAGRDEKQTKKAKVYEYYVNRQQSMYALDFDDLLLWVRKLFATNEECLKKWQYRFQFILVDEFQDVDDIQYDIIKQLAGNSNQVYVVGDPDQTIYTWRGANVEIIMHFEKDFAPCETIVLDENYRSTPMILNGANSLIQNNHTRIEKNLFSRRDDGDAIVHYTASSEDEEALWIAGKIHDLHKQGEPYSHIAVLYRANYLSRSVEKGLLDYHIPYVIYGGVRFYDRMEIKDMLCYLRMLCTADDLAFKRIMNQPKRGLGNKTEDALLEEARRTQSTMYEVVDTTQAISKKAKMTLGLLKQQIESWKEQMAGMELDQVLEMVFQQSGYRTMLEEAKDDDRIANIKELMNDLHDFQTQYPESDLAEYLQMVNLYTEREEGVNSEYVQLMTIHAAKGLEFDTVFVCGLSEGVFPSDRSLVDGIKGLEEERRLAYVAYTRAKNRLFLSEPQGFSFVLSRSRTTSRFIREIDPNYITHIGHALAMRDASKPLAAAPISPQGTNHPSKKVNYKKGDLVRHVVFGEGIVLQINGNMMDVAFSHPHGVKTLMMHHHSLTKL